MKNPTIHGLNEIVERLVAFVKLPEPTVTVAGAAPGDRPAEKSDGNPTVKVVGKATA